MQFLITLWQPLESNVHSQFLKVFQLLPQTKTEVLACYELSLLYTMQFDVFKITWRTSTSPKFPRLLQIYSCIYSILLTQFWRKKCLKMFLINHVESQQQCISERSQLLMFKIFAVSWVELVYWSKTGSEA